MDDHISSSISISKANNTWSDFKKDIAAIKQISKDKKKVPSIHLASLLCIYYFIYKRKSKHVAYKVMGKGKPQEIIFYRKVAERIYY